MTPMQERLGPNGFGCGTWHRATFLQQSHLFLSLASDDVAYGYREMWIETGAREEENQRRVGQLLQSHSALRSRFALDQDSVIWQVILEGNGANRRRGVPAGVSSYSALPDASTPLCHFDVADSGVRMRFHHALMDEVGVWAVARSLRGELESVDDYERYVAASAAVDDVQRTVVHADRQLDRIPALLAAEPTVSSRSAPAVVDVPKRKVDALRSVARRWSVSEGALWLALLFFDGGPETDVRFSMPMSLRGVRQVDFDLVGLFSAANLIRLRCGKDLQSTARNASESLLGTWKTSRGFAQYDFVSMTSGQLAPGPVHFGYVDKPPPGELEHQDFPIDGVYVNISPEPSGDRRVAVRWPRGWVPVHNFAERWLERIDRVVEGDHQ